MVGYSVDRVAGKSISAKGSNLRVSFKVGIEGSLDADRDAEYQGNCLCYSRNEPEEGPEVP